MPLISRTRRVLVGVDDNEFWPVRIDERGKRVHRAEQLAKRNLVISCHSLFATYDDSALAKQIRQRTCALFIEFVQLRIN